MSEPVAHFRELHGERHQVRFRTPVDLKMIDEFAREECHGRWCRIAKTGPSFGDQTGAGPADRIRPAGRVIGYIYIFESVSDAVLVQLRFG